MRATVLVALLTLLPPGCTRGEPGSRPVVLATTTSTTDTGLLDLLVPMFEQTAGLQVKTVAVGTGKALELGRRGEADVLLVHAPDRESELVATGHGRRRRPVMHNDFVIVGPASDPAGLAGAKDAGRALARIATGGHPWISRGDESGTHVLELGLWQRAGERPTGTRYRETGQGMGATLRVASERRAYTLTDRGTFLATANLDLSIVVEADALLNNPYHVIEVVSPRVNAAGAAAFADFLVSRAAQAAIGSFEVGGHRLFHPDASE